MTTELTPDVKWAQRSCYSPEGNHVVLTIAIHDVREDDLKLDLQDPFKVILDAHSDRHNADYHLELNLHDDVYQSETVVNLTDRQLELTLYKAEPNSWWPKLLSDEHTPPYVRQDFDRWVNKDAQDGEPDPEEEHLKNMNRDQLRTMADAALSASQQILVPADSQSDSDEQEREEDSDSEEDEHDPDDDGPTHSDDDSDDSDDADPPPPPGGSNSNGHGCSEPDGQGSTGHTEHKNKSCSNAGSPSSGDSPNGLLKDSSNFDSGQASRNHPKHQPQQNTTGEAKDDDSDDETDDWETEYDSDDDTREDILEGKQNGAEDGDWIESLNGVQSMIQSAGRKLPWHLQPISFETWMKRSDRTIEISNFRQSRFLRLPREIRLHIYELAIVSDDPIQICPRLRPKYHSIYDELIADGAYKRNHTDSDLKKKIKRAKKIEGIDYFLGNDFKRCDAPGLLYVSRAVSEEASLVLYRKNTFAFRDIHGFVALECFLSTINRFSLNQLRKLEVHVPIWYHGRTLDRLRSIWVFKSAESFGLKKSTPHKDRIRGSFEACIRKLAKSARLKELDLIITPRYLQNWPIDYNKTTAEMPKNKQIVYAKRLSTEEYVFKHVLGEIPKLKVNIVAEDSYDSPLLREELVPGDHDRYEGYFSAIKAKCENYGFNYVRKQPAEVRDFLSMMFDEFTGYSWA